MPLCPNGAIPLAGAPAFFTFAESDILNALPTVAGFLTTWALGLPIAPQRTDDFCAVDPPTDLPGVADYLALAVPAVALASGTYRRFGNYIRYKKWTDNCGCQGAGALQDCGSSGEVGTAIALPPAGLTQISQLVVVPRGAIAVALDIAIHCNNATGLGGAFSIRCYDKNGSRIGDITCQPPCSVPFGWSQDGSFTTGDVYVTNPPATNTSLFSGTVFVSSAANWNGGNRGDLFSSSTFRWRCAGTTTLSPLPPLVLPPSGFPAAPTSSPCTSFQDVCNKLQLLDLQIGTILQSQAAPLTSYAESTTHAGLSGTGVQPLAPGTIAVRVIITTDNPLLRVRAGSPQYLFDRGFIVPIGAEGAVRMERRLSYNPQEFILPQLTSSVGYFFGPNIVASIIELVRGP